MIAPFITTPLSAIQRRAGAGTSVTYSNGGSTTGSLPPIPTDLLTPASGVGHGLTLTLAQTDSDSGPLILKGVEPTADLTISPHPVSSGPPPLASTAPIDQPPGGPSIDNRVLALGHRPHQTTSKVVLPGGWTNMTAVWTGTLTPPKSGLYVLSLEGSGGATLTLDGVPAVSDPLRHVSGRWSQAVQLTGGHHYQVRLHWQPFDHFTPAGVPSLTPGILTLGFKYVTPEITAAVDAARKAKVAVVFAGDFNSEAYDRPSLALPGDEDALISAVAAVNPHTVVVLNTGGPVLMPWIGNVAGVVEDWYPGEVDGSAIAAVLFGDVDPSGRLPVTFPVSQAQSPINTLAQWPGINLTSDFSEGLEVGYRYYHATGISPLFPFGFGLSYTHFSIGDLRVSRSPGKVDAQCRGDQRRGAVGHRRAAGLPHLSGVRRRAAGPTGGLLFGDSATAPEQDGQPAGSRFGLPGLPRWHMDHRPRYLPAVGGPVLVESPVVDLADGTVTAAESVSSRRRS